MKSISRTVVVTGSIYQSPRRLRAKYTHRADLKICTLCISRLRRAETPRGAAQNRKTGSFLTYHRRKGDVWQMERIVLSRRSSCLTSRAGYVISRIQSGRKICMLLIPARIRNSGSICQRRIRRILPEAERKGNVLRPGN